MKPKVYRLSEAEAQDHDMKKGYVFMAKGGAVSMEAQHVADYVDAPTATWKVIPGLGRTLSGVALFPYTHSVDGASLSYQMNFRTSADSVDVYVTLAAVMPFLRGGHHMAVCLDGGKEVVVGLNQNLNWEHKYDLMYPTAAARVIEKKVRLKIDVSKTEHILRLRPLQPGIVFEKILIDNGGYVPSRLGISESSYVFSNK